MTINTAQSCAELNLNIATANTSLIVDGADLTISGGNFTLTNPCNNFNGTITIQNGGSITVNADAVFTRTEAQIYFR